MTFLPTWYEVLRPNPGPRRDDIFIYVFWTDFGLFVLRLLLAFASVIFGITSWTLVVKWRKFQNYLFINGIVLSAFVAITMYAVNNLCLFGLILPSRALFEHQRGVVLAHMSSVLFRIAMSHWLFVATVMFYLDTVLVFYNRMIRKYLLTNMFVWVAPIAEGAVLYTAVFFWQLELRHVEYITVAITFLFLLANTVLYLKVLYALIILARRGNGSCRDLCEKISLSFATCVTSGLASYLPLTLVILCTPSPLTRYCVCIVSIVSVIGATVSFWSLRSHRDAWGDYLRLRKMKMGAFVIIK